MTIPETSAGVRMQLPKLLRFVLSANYVVLFEETAKLAIESTAKSLAQFYIACVRIHMH